MADGLQIDIDLNRCVGSTMCAQFAPTVYEIDENGQSRVLDASAASTDEAVDAASQCPMEAITVIDGATGTNLFPGD